ncbi:MAG: DUF1835 domain-containing protein [Hymenobacteraceae bacterium]|nr:DUF1835 domain-containing protein [Hymenobacteraceae bacterium]
MQMKQFHVLNGDASLPAFKLAELPGDVLVWREVLSEGPVNAAGTDADFWQQRKVYICNTYSETPDGYRAKVLEEVRKLQQAPVYTEVVLWFDTDLMCQVNLLYLVQLLHKSQVRAISIATPTHKPVAQLLPRELQFLYDQRKGLQAGELQLADQLWQAYSSSSPESLQQLLSTAPAFLPNLTKAMQSHLRRFPSCHNGLSHPEQVLLEILDTGVNYVPNLMQQFWQKAPAYGFGDSQLLEILGGLSPELVQLHEQKAGITDAGKAVLEQKNKRQEVKPFHLWLGGVAITGPETDWCWHTEKGCLIKS